MQYDCDFDINSPIGDNSPNAWLGDVLLVAIVFLALLGAFIWGTS